MNLQRGQSPIASSLALAAMILQFAATAPGTAKERAAFVIGNGQYRNAPLRPQAIADAAAVADMLRKIGFEVSERTDLDRSGMKSATEQFMSTLSDTRIIVLFYSGGAAQVQGRSYLLPVDASLSATTDLGSWATDLNSVLGPLSARDRTVLALLDIDRDNPLKLAPPSARPPEPSSSAILIMYSTGPGQRIVAGSDRNSPFTAALLKHLPTPGLELGNATQLIRADVLAATNRRQIPWDHNAGVGRLVLVPIDRKP